MTVEVYKGRHFQHGHERRALGKFLQDLKHRFGESDELYFVIIEVDANGASMDLLLLCPRTIIIADLKQLTAADEKDAELVQISCKQNGGWEYTIPGSEQKKFLGGAANAKKNPYKQIEQIRYKFADWLTAKSNEITGRPWSREETLGHLKGWAVLSPGFDGNTAQLDLPWDEIRAKNNWFRVISLKNLAWEFHCTTDQNFEFTEREMRAFVSLLGATKVDNWGELLPDVFPNDLPPVPVKILFSDPPQFSRLVGRDQESAEMLGWIDDPGISFLSIKGMGGIGKTSILGYLAHHTQSAGWQIKHIACKEKELTTETFLAAVASEVKDRVMAHLILDKGVSLLDRVDVVLNYLEKEKTLILIDDFQKVETSKDIARFLLRVPAHAPGIKVVIASREHPEVIDHPTLLFGSVRELQLEGLSPEEISVFFEDLPKVAGDPERMDWIWERTRGNPYAIGLLKPLIRNYGWSEIITGLPLYQNDRDQWFESLVETLDKDARLLAQRVSVVRTVISGELIAQLWHEPKSALFLTHELVDKNVLQKSDLDGQFIIHDFIRDYLYDHFSDGKQQTKAHLDAGGYYKHLAEKAANEYQASDALYEAIYHFEQAGREDEILKLARQAYDLLYDHGDSDRAQIISNLALKASRSKNQPLEISRWLVNLGGWEFDHDQIKEAGLHLQQALDQLPKPGPKTSEQEKSQALEIKANIFIEKGRIAYYISEFDRAKKHYTEALTIINEIKNAPLYAECLIRIARIERQKGDFRRSRKNFELAIQIAQKYNHHQIAIQAISHLALISRQENNYEMAHKLFTDAYEYAKRIGDWRGMEINYSLLGDLARRQGDYATAVNIFEECLKASRRVGNGVSIRINLGQLAEALIRMGSLEEAKPYLAEAEERSKKAGDGIGIACTLERQGLLKKKQGDLKGGDQLIRQAIDKLREIGSEVYIKEFEKELGPLN